MIMPYVIIVFFLVLIVKALNGRGSSELTLQKNEDDNHEDDSYTFLAGNNSFITNPPNIEINTINPATGLPMIGGMGGVDVGGNIYGSSAHDLLSSLDINPATGLPMIGGMGGIDVGGHTYGSDH